MSEIDEPKLDKLTFLKACVSESYFYFKDNCDRFNYFQEFIYSTALSPSDISKLQILQKPTIEFNVLESYISRQMGEFADHEPGLAVSVADSVFPQNINKKLSQTIDVVEGHTREIISQVTNDGFEDKIYKDLLSGGFSVAKCSTDYINPMSFEQKICIDRVFDPTLCGFDPMARASHKGDGRYCFELIPKTKDEFEKEFGKEATKNMEFTRNVKEFNWSYKNSERKIVLLCNFFEKVARKEKIAKLSNGKTILSKHYKQILEVWDKMQRIEQPPEIIEERYTMIETVENYIFSQNEIYEHNKTDYGKLPLVFFDGNSVMLKQKGDGSTSQMTRPYVYQAKGVQMLKNFAGQTIGAEIENMVEHKFMAAIESIPEDYRDAYDNPQQAQTLVYNAFYDKNPEQPLPPPREIQRTPTPQIVQETFMGTDAVTQTILGSYDAQMGITNGQISGKAIQQGAMHSSAAAKPYLMGFINGLNRIGEIILDLIPKYYVTPRSIPVLKSNGLRDYQIINDSNNPESIKISYKPEDLQIKIEAGINTNLQKQMALQQIIQLMSASELFAAFMNQDGLSSLLDNVDIRGIDDLKIKAEEFMQRMKEQQEAQAGKPDPMQEMVQGQIQVEQAKVEVEASKVEQRREQAQGELQIKAGQLAIDKEKADLEFLYMLAEAEQLDAKSAREQARLDADMTKDAVEMAMKMGTEMSRQGE